VTFLEKLQSAEGRPSGFDHLRLILAIAVVCQHSLNTTMGLDRTVEVLNSPLRAPIALILPMFFTLSGFLVSGSLLRSKSLVSFAGLRILRIGPALCFEVCLAALVLGPVLTSWSLQAYFADERFSHYFLNILGDIHYKLPGLFPDNPTPDIVNGQLWTVPYELECYIALSLLAVVGIAFHRVAFLILLGLGQAASIAFVVLYDPVVTMAFSGPLLVFCFLIGVGCYLWRDKLPYNGKLAWLCAALLSILLLTRYGDYFAAAPAGYLTCYLGLANPPKPRFLESGDYSYGIFLYGYPIQQAVSSLGPGLWHWWLNIAICVPLSLLAAIISWHLVEKHALALKPRLMAAEGKILARFKFFGFWLRRPPALALNSRPN